MLATFCAYVQVHFATSSLLLLCILQHYDSCVLQVRNVLLTVALFCGPMLLTFSFLNTVAIAYHSTAALPFGTICVIFVIWALITFPLTVLGGIAGKNKQVSPQLS